MYSDSADNADTDQPTREYNQQQYIARTRQSRQYHYNKQQQQQRRGFLKTQNTSMPSSLKIKSKQSFDVPPSSRNISSGIGSSSNHTPQHSSNNDFITPRNRITQHNTNKEYNTNNRTFSSHMSSSEPSSRSGNRRRTSMLRTRNESNLVVDSTTTSSSHGLSSSYRRKSKTTGHNHNSSNSSLTETPHRYNSHCNSSSRNKKKVKESPMIGFYSNSKSYLPRNTSFSFTTPYPFVLASSSESNNSCDPYPYYEGCNYSSSGERGGHNKMMMTMDSSASTSNNFSPSTSSSILSSTTTPRSLFRDMSDSAHSSSSNRYNMMNRVFVWKTRYLYRVLLPFLLVSGVVCTFMVSSDLYLHTQVSLTRKNHSSSVSAAGARVLYLNNELHNPQRKKKTKISGAFPVPKQRTVQEYPTEFSDNTQLYGILDSSDPALALMEIREPYIDEKKALEPLAKWQTQFHPSCNDMHTLDFAEPEQFAELFGTKGYWRHAWHVAQEFSSEKEDHVVVKTLKYEHNFEDAHFEHDRIDAVAMERLTSSPHVINIYGFCGHSVVTEYADGKRLGSLADKQKLHPEILLQIALDIANGMNDIHTISIEDGIDEKRFNIKGDMNTFVHLDVNPANVVSVGGTLKFNDFNIGIMRKWNRTSSSLAGFPAQYPNPQWRSPEEAANSQTLNEKVDIFSMGHIFFRLICGHEPWNKLEIDPPQPTKDQINEKVKQGILPHIPEEIMESKDFAVVAIREAMLKCYTFDPQKRPSAKEIARGLDKALEKLKKAQNKISGW